MLYRVTVEKTQTCSGVVEVEADGPVAAQELVDRKIESGELQTTAVNWDDPEYDDGSFKTTGDTEEGPETICCDHCGHEYDRHIGDMCPACNHNNHEQYVEKFGD